MKINSSKRIEKANLQTIVSKLSNYTSASANEVYVFDMDGTLLDSNHIARQALYNLAEENGFEFSDELVTKIIPLGFDGGTRFYMEHFGLTGTFEEEKQRFIRSFIDAYKKGPTLKDGVESFLKSLKKRGARLFVLTANIHEIVDPCLKSLDIYDLFETVWSVDDFGMNKADVRIYASLAERIGCKVCEINFFDDSVIAIETAAKAGCSCYGVFDNHSESDTLRLQKSSKRVVRNYNDLLEN